MNERDERLIRIDSQIQQTILRAQLNIAKINQGEYKIRNTRDGYGRALTDSEKLRNAIASVNAQIEQIDEFTEYKIKLLKD